MLSRPYQIKADAVQQPPTKQDLVSLVYKYADDYSVSSHEMISLISCEDSSWNPSQQSNVTNEYGRERSFGLSQIFLPAHTEITQQQADDPNFAIEFMASELAKGKVSEWSCSRILGYD